MKYSIKKQLAIIFTTLITGTILVCLILNTTLLENYYVNKKTKALERAYNSINAASKDGDIKTEQYDIELQKICGKYNINVVVADSDTKTIKASMNEPQLFINQLLNNIINGVDEDDVIRKTDNYEMQIVTDFRTQTEYIEMWGLLDNGYIFMIRSPLEGIQESVSISNHFLAYVGIGAILISTVLVFWFSKRITKPILKLAEISERVKNLDFDAKYEGNEKTEIAVLGNNINEMSEALEETISELRTANNELKKDIEKKNQIDEMRKEFLSNVSHELKTPIALIQGYAGRDQR